MVRYRRAPQPWIAPRERKTDAMRTIFRNFRAFGEVCGVASYLRLHEYGRAETFLPQAAGGSDHFRCPDVVRGTCKNFSSFVC